MSGFYSSQKKRLSKEEQRKLEGLRGAHLGSVLGSHINLCCGGLGGNFRFIGFLCWCCSLLLAGFVFRLLVLAFWGQLLSVYIAWILSLFGVGHLSCVWFSGFLWGSLLGPLVFWLSLIFLVFNLLVGVIPFCWASLGVVLCHFVSWFCFLLTFCGCFVAPLFKWSS